MTIWQPGMRCVCVDDSLWRGTSGVFSNPPLKGGVYAVSGTGWMDELCVVLEEYPFPPRGAYWFARCFRPLSENRLDSLRALLNPTPARKKEQES